MLVPSRAGRVAAALAFVPLAAWTAQRVVPHSAASAASAAAALPDSSFLKSYRWRNIGPDRGGRSIAVERRERPPERGATSAPSAAGCGRRPTAARTGRR